MSAPQAWHLITCEYPPQIGGVAAYSQQVAAALVRVGEAVHVWGPGHEGDQTGPDGVVVHRRLGSFSLRDCVRTGRALDAFARRRLFVQWVPHGYGWKSMNLPFAAWLAWRARVRGDDLHVMVHEPYMRVTWPPSHVVAASVEKVMLWLIGRAASHVWISTPSWEPFVRRYTRRQTPLAWLAIPAPDGVPAHAPDAPEAATPAPVIGHFSTHSPVVTAMLGPALAAALRTTSEATALLMGRDSDRYRDQFVRHYPDLSGRVMATGVLDIGSVVSRMRECAIMLQPFPDGITARNTSMLLALAAGACVASNTGPLTEALWAAQPAVALADGVDPARLAAVTNALLADRPRRLALGAAARRLYAEQFDISRSAAVLAGSVRADTPGAPRASHAEA